MAEEKKQGDVIGEVQRVVLLHVIHYVERKGQTPKGERMVEVTSRRPPSPAQKQTGEGD